MRIKNLTLFLLLAAFSVISSCSDDPDLNVPVPPQTDTKDELPHFTFFPRDTLYVGSTQLLKLRIGVTSSSKTTLRTAKFTIRKIGQPDQLLADVDIATTVSDKIGYYEYNKSIGPFPPPYIPFTVVCEATDALGNYATDSMHVIVLEYPPLMITNTSGTTGSKIYKGLPCPEVFTLTGDSILEYTVYVKSITSTKPPSYFWGETFYTNPQTSVNISRPFKTDVLGTFVYNIEVIDTYKQIATSTYTLEVVLPDKPTIVITNPQSQSITAISGDDINIDLLCTGYNLKDITVTRSVGGAPTTIYSYNMPGGTNPIPHTVTLSVSSTGNIEYVFQVVDTYGQTDTVQLHVKSISIDDVPYPSAPLLSGQMYTYKASKESSGCSSAWNLIKDQGILYSATADSIDMGNLDSLGTFTGTFQASNLTTFVQANATFDYAGVTFNKAKDAYIGGIATASAKITNPQKNKVYIAKVRGKEIYIPIKITDRSTTDLCSGSTAAGKLSFEYKKR